MRKWERRRWKVEVLRHRAESIAHSIKAGGRWSGFRFQLPDFKLQIASFSGCGLLDAGYGLRVAGLRVGEVE